MGIKGEKKGGTENKRCEEGKWKPTTRIEKDKNRRRKEERNDGIDRLKQG